QSLPNRPSDTSCRIVFPAHAPSGAAEGGEDLMSRSPVDSTGRTNRHRRPPASLSTRTTGRIPMCVKDGLMRIHPGLAALSSACLLMAAGESTARAQQPAGAVYESGGFGEALEGRVRLTSAGTDAPPASQVRSQSPGI